MTTTTSMSLGFDLGEDIEALVGGVTSVLSDFADDYWTKQDSDTTYPKEYVDAMAKAGWLGLTVPEDFGGGGLGYVAGTTIMRTIAASGAGLNGCIPVHMSMFAAAPIVNYGSDAIKKEFLPGIVSGDQTLCFMVSEPDTGSDTSRLKTRATPTADGWVINGQKVWITQSHEADLGVLLARTSDSEERFGGMSVFLVDMNDPALSKRTIAKLPHAAVRSCEVFIEDLRVPKDRLIGVEGEGFSHILAGFNAERVLMSGEMVGIGEAALRHAVEYATERETFGRPIGANQAISHPLARAEAQLHAAWLAVLEAAWTMDHGQPAGEVANRAKLLAADACWEAADTAMQVLGGMAFAKEAHVERYFREARLLRVAPISQEMALNYLAQKVLGLPRSY